MPKHCLCFLLLLLLAGCTRSPQRLSPTPVPLTVEAPVFVSLPPEQAIPQMIAAERQASRSGNLALLAQLWGEDATIVDSRGTNAPGDDFTWPSRAAILDRYKLAVLPAPPPAMEALPEPVITVQGNEAQAINSQDHWRFLRQEGRWWMVELRY